MSGASTPLVSQASDKPLEGEKKLIKGDFNLLPMSFEPNQGQSSSDAKFLAHGRGFSALFKKNEADFFLTGHDAVSGLLRVTLINASDDAAMSGEERLPGTVNYFIGDDPGKWHTGLPTFERLRYSKVYPGTDLIYYGNKGHLEFDFQLSPGAAPSNIQMHFEGAKSLRIDGKGNLVVTAKDGQIVFRRPIIYQPAEAGRKDFVTGNFRIIEEDSISFAVSRYDRSRPLIIDPILNYSTYIGTEAGASSIAVDQNGEAYITGWATPDFPTTAGSYEPISSSAGNTFPSGARPFVAKFNSTGTALLYSTFLSGSGIDVAIGIGLDSNGDAFLVGNTTSKDFPTTAGALQSANNASKETGFVTELNSAGSSLLYSTYFGGSTFSSISGVTVDGSGNAYLTGTTQDTNFPTTPGAYKAVQPAKTTAGSNSAFVAKLNPLGTGLIYSSYLGGNQGDVANTIAVDSAGEAYVGGNTTSTNFPATSGAIQSTREASSAQSGFVAKLNASGTALLYSTYLGGSSSDGISAIAIDSSGDAYVTGGTNSPDFPVTSGAFQPKIGYTSFQYPQTNAFVSELNSSGTSLVYSTFLGGGISLGEYADEGDGARAIAVDGQGMVYLTGTACTGNFPITASAFETQNLDGEYSEGCTAFLTKMNPVPNVPLVYSTYFGGTGQQFPNDLSAGDGASGLVLGATGNIYLAGYTGSVDFPTTANVVETAFTCSCSEAFVAEFNVSEMKTLPRPTVTLTSSASAVLFGQPVTFTATVQPASGNSAPTGYVGFNFLEPEVSDNLGTGIGFGPWTTVPLNGAGVASFTTSSLVALQTPVNAFYLGDANNAPAVGTMTQTVTDISTSTTVTSSANNVPYGASVVFTATVLDNKGKPAKGFVFFMLGNISYASPGLDSAGHATWVNGTGGPPLPVGTDTVEVEYFPYTGYQASSGTLAETFTPLGTTPDPSFNPPSGTYKSEQQVTLSDSNSAAIVYYTQDGSTPVPGTSPGYQPGYGMTIPVNASETINAIAVASGYSPSNMVSATYTLQPSFTAGTGGSNSITVTRGATSGNTGTVSVEGRYGFSGTVGLTCAVTTSMTNVNDTPTCSLSPPSVTISGTTAQTSTLAVNTTAASSAKNEMKRLFWLPAGGTALALLLFFISPKRPRGWPALLGLLTLFVFLSATGCGGSGGGGAGGKGGGGGDSGTTAGTYTITVTGTSGTISASVGTITLTVQ